MLLTDRGVALSLTIERLARHLKLQSGPGELTQAGASALARLDEEGPMGVTALAQAENVSQPSMTQLIGRLCLAGLADRRVRSSDRRAVRIHLTAQGQQRVNQRRERRAAELTRDLAELSSADQQVIAGAIPALERLTEVIAARRTTAETEQEG